MADSININQPGLPEYEKRTDSDKTTTSSGGSTTMQLAPEATAALGQVGQATDKQETVAQAQGELDVAGKTEDNAVEQELNAQQQQLAQEKMAALTGKFAATGEVYQQAKARIKQAQDRYESMEAPALFANRDNAGKYRLGIAMALAGLGDAMRQAAMVRIGKDPGSASTVKDIINADLNRQKEAIEKAKDSLVIAKTGLKDVDDARNALIAEIDMKGAILAGKAAAQLRANMAARGISQAQIDSDKRIADLEQFKATKQLDVAGTLHTTVDKHFSTAIKNGTEEINRVPSPTQDKSSPHELQTAEFAGQMEHEIDLIKKNGVIPSKEALATAQDNESKMGLADKGGLVGVAALAGRAMGVVPRSPSEGVPEKQQQLINGWNNGAELVYHKLTGAGMAESEARRLADNLKYQSGDSPGLAKQKLERLENFAKVAAAAAGPSALDRMRAAIGGPADKTRVAPAVAPAAPATAAAAPQAAPVELSPAKRAQAVELLRKMAPGERRSALAAKLGILEEELNSGR